MYQVNSDLYKLTNKIRTPKNAYLFNFQNIDPKNAENKPSQHHFF